MKLNIKMNRTDMEKKKVLILGKVPPPYFGPAVATQIILNSDLKNSYKLIHLDTRLNKSLKTIDKLQIKKAFKIIGLYWRMKKIIMSCRPDLVLIPISQSTVGFVKDSLFILIARLFGRKVLIHLRGSNLQNWLQGASFIGRSYVEWVIRRCQGAIVLGNNLRYLFEKYFPEERIFVVPNGGDYNFPETSSVNTDKIVNILYLANLVPTKGIQHVIEAVRLLTEEDRNNRNKLLLEVVGEWWDEKLRDVLMRKVEENKLPVCFHPPAGKEKKLEFLSKAEIFVFPPYKPEGHPWVIVEAMAAGLPIISTDQGAIVESVVNGKNGFIVEPKRPDQIAEKIKFLIEKPEIRNSMGQESRNHYMAHFTQDKMVNNLRNCFNQLIQNNGEKNENEKF